MAKKVIRDLLDRRVPQYLAVYGGACWGVIEFFALMEDRFLLSPHLTNFVLLLVALPLPSVVMFIYHHGRAGPDPWRRIEKIFIPLNAAATAAVLFFVFAGKDLGSMTTRITVEDEDGHAVERVVPKSEFRKRLAVFPFDASAADAWLGDAVSNALITDLAQDMFLDIQPALMFREPLRQAGFPDGRGVPAPLKRRIAQERHLAYFVGGTASRTADGFRIAFTLSETARGRPVETRTFEGPDLLELVDQASVQLRRDLGLPSRYVDDTQDRPVAEIMTADVDALRRYAEGIAAVWYHDDFSGAYGHLSAAVELDPTFAFAHLALYQVRLFSGDAEGAAESVRRTMDLSYRLPERAQFVVRAEWYAIQGDFPRSIAAYEMWADLYPQDVQAQLAAMQMRLFQGDRRGAIEKLELVLDLEPTRTELLRQIGALHEALGDVDRALEYFERYARLYPEDKDSYTPIARVHRRAGDHDQARAAYERALLLEPDAVEILIERALLDRDLGDFDDALSALESALAAARTPDQRIAALGGLQQYYAYRGAYRQALEYTIRSLDEIATSQPPVAQIQFRMMSLPVWVRAGQPDAAIEQLDQLAAQLPPPIDALVPIGRIGVYEALGWPDELEAAIADGEAMLTRTSLNALKQMVVYGRGRAHELRGDWVAAVRAFEEERELEPTDISIAMQIGRAYREAGDLRRAESFIQETLTARPSDPRAHYELALVHERMGRHDDAARHLERALAGWRIADEQHRYATLARERLAAREG